MTDASSLRERRWDDLDLCPPFVVTPRARSRLLLLLTELFPLPLSVILLRSSFSGIDVNFFNTLLLPPPPFKRCWD
jgi:hypothetical protein